jgi:hypothetical protein
MIVNRRSIPFDVGFDDGEVESYHKSGDSFRVVVRAWNNRVIHIDFGGVVRMLDNDAGEIADLCEVTLSSEFLEAAIQRVYDEAPAQTTYRHFQLVDAEGTSVVDVAAESISLSFGEEGE